jgi:flagellar export protein FliJ
VKAFRFSLQQVLEWRAVQLRSEEEKLAGLQRQLSALLIRDKELQAAMLKSELDLRARPVIPGLELGALPGFRRRAENQRHVLLQACAKLQRDIDQQRKQLLEARRDHRVLEKLREKRRSEWAYLSDREIEDIAAEAYLAKWAPPK